MYNKELFKAGYLKGQSKATFDAISDIVFAQRQQCVKLSIPTREDNTAEKMWVEGKDGTEILIGSGLACVCVCVW